MYELCWIPDRLFRLLIKALYQYLKSGKMPQLQTADGHRLAVMGAVQAQLQFQHFSTKHEFLVTNKLITPVILSIDFLSKHAV